MKGEHEMDMIVDIAMRFMVLTFAVLSIVGIWYLSKLLTMLVILKVAFKNRCGVLMHPRRLQQVLDAIGIGVILFITWAMVSSPDLVIVLRSMAFATAIIYMYMIVDKSEYKMPMGDPTFLEFVESIGLTALYVWPVIFLINWIASFYTA